MTLLPSLFVCSTVPKGHLYHAQSTPTRAQSVPTRFSKVGAGVISGTCTTGSKGGKSLGAMSNSVSLGCTASSKRRGSLGVDDDSMNIAGDGSQLLPTRGFSASDMAYKTMHSAEWSKSRVRTEWIGIGHDKDKIQGVIRNLKVLGIIGEKLVVAYQGNGRVRTYLHNGSSVELQPTGDGEDNRKKYCRYVDAHNHIYRYAEYNKPPLPTKVLVIGETSVDGASVTQKPRQEATTRARVTVCGHVTDCQSFVNS
eukprot:TRINITY_DN43397_c0_g1_i1.p1 TRINITY_DN43397_c0_g1~~TRINITY_DN43397_c0_g1_i1.p1  ORF type:complete len:254 (+),score=23.63 TRINITY_DN43397_c0_g1_i1:117-878(+)